MVQRVRAHRCHARDGLCQLRRDVDGRGRRLDRFGLCDWQLWFGHRRRRHGTHRGQVAEIEIAKVQHDRLLIGLRRDLAKVESLGG